jgi:hypothetical protein
MRKLLLASAAMLGATAGIASAQPAVPLTSNPMQGQMAYPSYPGNIAFSTNNVNAQPDTYVGLKIGLVPLPAPNPGTVIVRLGGRIENDFMASTVVNYPGSPAVAAVAATATAPAKGAVAAVSPAKFNPIAFASYLRLYPAVDGMATNGLRYGAQAEIRENFASSGSDPYPSNNPAASPSGSTSAQTLFVRRSFAYIGGDNVGVFRFGQSDGVIGLFDPCFFSSGCNDAGFGGFQTGLGGLGPTSNIGNNGDYFALAQNGADYGNVKFVYLSPQLFGVDVGFQYAPNMENSNAACSVASANQLPLGASNTGILPTPAAGNTYAAAGTAPGCTDTTSGTDGTRWYNQVGVGARWQADLSPTLHAGAYVFYEHAAPEDNYVASTIKTATWSGHYAALDFIQAAYYMRMETPVGNFMTGMTFEGGNVNSTLALTTQGGQQMRAFQPYLTYQNGPWVVGLDGFFLTEQGTAALTGISQRHESGVYAAINYNLAPGLYVMLEYQYETRHQGNLNFITGAVGPANNDVHASALILATIVNW